MDKPLVDSDLSLAQVITTERLTTPHLLEVHKSDDGSTFGIGFYDGRPQIPVPIVIDAVFNSTKLGLTEKTEDVIPVSQKEAFVMKLLTSRETITDITQEVFGEGLKDFIEDEIGINVKLDRNFKPNITVSIVGPSHIGKSHLVAQLNKLGWYTHNLDARNIMLNYEQQIQIGNIPPFEEPKKSMYRDYATVAMPDDVSAYSTVELLKIVKSLNDATRNSSVTIIDSGGFSSRDQKARPDSPLLALTRASDVLILIDNELRTGGPISHEKIASLIQKNPGLQWIVARDLVAGYDATGKVEEVAADFDLFLKDNMNAFERHALKLRYQFATALMTPRLIQKVAEFGSVIK